MISVTVRTTATAMCDYVNGCDARVESPTMTDFPDALRSIGWFISVNGNFCGCPKHNTAVKAEAEKVGAA